MKTNGQSNMGFSPTLTCEKYFKYPQYYLVFVVVLLNSCLDPFVSGNDEGMEVVKAIEVAEVAKTATLGVFNDDNALINAFF